jgi:hypothetical protein
MKTKRHKLHNKRKKRTYRNSNNYKTYRRYKLYGGDGLSTPNQNNNSINQIMEQVKAQRKVDLGNNEIIQKMQNLLKGFFIQATEKIAKLANVDINDSTLMDAKLDQIKNALNNPNNKEKLKEITNELSKNAAVVIQAASPFLNELVDKIVPIGTKTLSEIGEAIVKIGLNTVEEIPGVGILVGTIRSIGNAGEAIAASTNAAAEVVTIVSDALKGSIMNYNKIAQENAGRLNNINKSINQFKQTPLNVGKNMASQIPQSVASTMFT